MKHALITGGAGFIGLHLARHLLRQGWRVDLVDNFMRGRRDPDVAELLSHTGVILREGDLGDPAFRESLGRNYSEVFHLAAILGVENVIDRPYDVLDANVRLTSGAIEIARRQRGLARLLFASTSEVYAGTLEHFQLPLPTPESTPLAVPPLKRPRTSYMLSKLFGEALCLQAGVPVTIVRPHNVYGPRMGQSHVVPQLLERAYKAPPDGTLDVYSIDHTRTFCYIDDAVEMIVRLATSSSSEGEAVNVGTEEPEISIGALAEIIIAVVGKPLRITSQPPTQGSPARRAPDMSLCKRITGYCSTIGIEEGLERTFAWYRDRIFT